jgi:trans-aconitate 2-methyltransferase
VTWDAATYDRVSEPLVDLAGPVIDRLELTGKERVLDAGCGSGRVTELLCGRAAEVVGVDDDPNMVAEARRRLRGRARILQRGLTWMTFEEPFDAVLSTATLHWIDDHDAVFARFAQALGPGGRLSFQCGGVGNLASVLRAADVPPRWRFPGPEETEERLGAAGFEQVVCWLEAVEVRPAEPRTYLEAIVFRCYEDPQELAARVDEPTLDYVRLNGVAVRG